MYQIRLNDKLAKNYIFNAKQEFLFTQIEPFGPVFVVFHV